jgi:ABC-2 type transport system permease protein
MLFPLIFLFVFGSFSKHNDVSFNVAFINNSNTGFAQKFEQDVKYGKTFKINSQVKTLEQAKEKMSRSEIDAAIVLPKEFGETSPTTGKPTGLATIYYDNNSAEAARTIKNVLDGEFEHFNSHIVKVPTPFAAESESISSSGLTRLDYTVAGLIGFSILGLGIFGPVNYFPQMKKEGVLRRLHITPLRPWQFFISSVLSNAVIGLISISVMLIVAKIAFGFKIDGNYLELAVFIAFGILSIFGIGLAIGGWAKNENQAAPLANIVVFPMMFLSGTFFPRYSMPEWLQHVSAYLPLTPVIDGIRMIATENKHLVDLGPQLGLMVVWTAIIYLIAFRVFRWE